MAVNRRRSKLLALIFAVLAGAASFLYLFSLPDRAGEEQPVVIALQDIPRGELITSRMVTIGRMNKSSVTKYTARRVRDVLNKRVTSTIYQGEQVLSSRIGASNKGSEIAYLVREGKVAIAVPADPLTTVGNAIGPGDLVDVLMTTGSLDEGPEASRFKNVRVIGANGGLAAGSEEERADQSGRASFGESTIIIEVTPEQAEKIAFYSERAKLRFALRPKGAR